MSGRVIAATFGLLGACLLTGLVRAEEVPAVPIAEAVPTLTEIAPAPIEQDCPASECKEEPSWRSRVPVVTKLPPLGMQTFLPTGPGYYSLLDQLEGNYREKPPKYPYPRFGIIMPSFADFSFAYLDDPKNEEHDTFDCLKRIEIGDCMMFSTGGDLRYRYASETNSRLSGRSNVYGLARARAYGDLWLRDDMRVYVEGIYADSFQHDLNHLPIDINRGDLLNAFVDVKLLELGEKDRPAYARVGRQELLYGSQRLISTLDWANTRRTYQGAKLFYRGDKVDVDLFCVQPVAFHRNNFDSVDNNQVFTGLWGTVRPREGTTIDLYYLNLDQTSPVATGTRGRRGGYNLNTVGARYFGAIEDWRVDAEGALQAGSVVDRDSLAGMLTFGVGHVFKDCPMKPQFWAYYDYASGTDDPNDPSRVHTFNQLFPFGHYYFGFADLVGRQNIHDFSCQAAVYPLPWITVLGQFHRFYLDSSRDALYNAAGVALRRDPTGQAGNEVGSEFDLVVNLHLTTHVDVLLSYSHFFAGPFVKQTGPGNSADYMFVQCSYRW